MFLNYLLTLFHIILHLNTISNMVGFGRLPFFFYSEIQTKSVFIEEKIDHII